MAAQRAPTRMAASERRRQILDVTRALVAESGFHGVSIESVAQRAGISRPVVYEHFGDLSGLLEALIDEVGERALRQLVTVLPPPGPAGERREVLLAALRGYLEAARADPETWRLVLMPPEGAPQMMRERINLGRAAVVATLADSVRTGIGTREGSPDPELTARTFSTLADDAARLILLEPDEYPVERLVAHARWLLGQLEPDQASAS